MPQINLITATITVVETNEVRTDSYPDVHAMSAAVEFSRAVAELAFGRRIVLGKHHFDGDNMYVDLVFEDTKQSYMKFHFVRHFDIGARGQ